METESTHRPVDKLIEIGRTWATYGLNAGKSALETSATTLKATADYLGDLTQRFNPPTEEETETTPTE